MGARLGKGWTLRHRVTYPGMRVIIGLGNPGQQYARSRHNAGFRVVDAFARKFRIDFDTHEKDAMTGRGRVGGGAVLVAKPQTFMNNSGHAARLLLAAYGERPDDLMIVYDEVDLPLGAIRIRPSGSSGTHNGMRSIVEALATESFPRLRFGVRGERYAETGELRDYVLDDFDADEEGAVEETIGRAVDALVLFARGDLRRAMNTFNGNPQKDVPAASEAPPAASTPEETTRKPS
jgi:peptidyl-tRNA hydrolase, PTH1 family